MHNKETHKTEWLMIINYNYTTQQYTLVALHRPAASEGYKFNKYKQEQYTDLQQVLAVG